MSELTLYGMTFSPFVRKVAVVCEEKQIDYRIEPVSPMGLPEELVPRAPLGKIPFAQIGDKWLADSSVICDYIDHLYPVPALYPSDPFERAQALWFEEYMDGGVVIKIGPNTFGQRVIGPLFLDRASDESVVEASISDDLAPVLDYLDAQIGDREFLVGDSFGIADVTVSGFFVNMKHADIEIDASRAPNLKRFCENHWKRPSIAKFIAEESENIEKLRAAAASS